MKLWRIAFVMCAAVLSLASCNSGEKRNCLQLTATYDDAGRDYMAYSCALTFAYADATTLRIQGYYVKAPDGWINYQRGPSEPSF